MTQILVHSKPQDGVLISFLCSIAEISGNLYVAFVRTIFYASGSIVELLADFELFAIDFNCSA